MVDQVDVAPVAGSEQAQMQQAANSMSPDKWEAVKIMLQKLPPAQREQWFKKFAANTGAMGADAQDAMTRADSLRVEEPGMVGERGGYQMAASPLAHIGAGMQNYQANKQYKQGAADLAKSRQAGADQRIAGAKASVGPLDTPPAAAPMTGPGGMALKGPGGMDMQQMLMALRSR